MQTSEFIKILQEALEMEHIEMNENTILAELDDYDSLSVMSIIAMADEHFDKKLTALQLSSITTVASLKDLIEA